MDDFEIIQLINDLHYEVRNFKKHRNKNAWQFSCEVCGDSKANPRKARFGVARKDGVWVCNCFNCGYSNTFLSYLKHFHPHIYDKVQVEHFKSNAPSTYDLNYLVDELSEKQLKHIFYINRYSNSKMWLEYLEKKKIKLERNKLESLYNLHKEHWL